MKFCNQTCGFLLGGALLLSGSAFAQTATPNAPAAPATSPSNRPITSLNPGPPPPAHPLTQAQTTEILNLMGFKKMEDANWSEMMAMSKARIPFMPPAVWTDVDTNLGKIDYPTTMQPIYAKYLSQEDAAKAITFFSTPAGKRVLQAMPMLMAESMNASQQKGREAANAAISAHRPEIEAARKQYIEEHTPKSSPAPGAGPANPTAPATSPAPSTPAPSATPQH